MQRRTTPLKPPTPSLRARIPEGQQQLDQVQHVHGAVGVDVLRLAAGDGGQSEADQTSNQVEDRGGAGVEEAFQADGLAAGDYTIRVTVLDCGATPGDGDGNCAIDVDDLVGLITGWGPGVSPYDFDEDGDTDVDDLVALILAWGPIENEYVVEVLSRD